MNRLALVLVCLGLSSYEMFPIVGRADSFSVVVEALGSRQSNGAASPMADGNIQKYEPADVLLVEAQALYRHEKYAEAQHLALESLTQKPVSSKAMYLLGYIAERQNNPRESLGWFTRAAAIEKPTGEDLRMVGLDYVLLNDYPDAVRWLTQAVAFDSKNSEAWYDLGRAYMMQSHFSAAEKALKRVLQLRPRSVRAENNLGITYEAENRPQDASDAYRRAIEWQTSSPQPSEQPLLNLGTLLVTQQRGAEAVPFLKQALKLAPGNEKAHEQLARGLEQAGQSERALFEMGQAVRLAPDDARLHYELGLMNRRAGKVQEAREELKLSRQLYGTHSTAVDH